MIEVIKEVNKQTNKVQFQQLVELPSKKKKQLVELKKKMISKSHKKYDIKFRQF